ncbi:Crp/Fnr family transcriptional regulator [Epilithonimonas hungarica]|uniref:cAMP-binding domain of CRP or a regulatory subunit of cAMP-dependent protein kinases n=1 Tax=Epilithonimonas hungarica TaxID=454006 RepID=A0A1G7SH16_9FLAO|nr:Crp/Fnr family transcriptional regulator [Epilithonimonas hungarica]SDG22278.1 cAMP-binding domain of CRP or a regulatory subunit of cAMP-dependent protein kinases [Epilithonimonas hungarica]
MVIEESIIKLFGGKLKEYNASEIIFSEKSNANYYYQIVEGEVKLNNYNEDGKETIQTILKKGQSIGESLLFLDKAYPINAIAITTCKVFRLPKSKFFQILNKFPENQFKIINSLSDSMYFKYVMGEIFCTQNPAMKLRVLMDYLKSSEKDSGAFSFQVPLTRQQMASLTGLRVETTIRALKMMEKENVVKIKNRKIFY